jgi:hypothetical protein
MAEKKSASPSNGIPPIAMAPSSLCSASLSSQDGCTATSRSASVRAHALVPYHSLIGVGKVEV